MELDFEEIESAGQNPFVEKFETFFGSVYRKHVETLVGEYPENRSLYVDFKELEKFDFQLADDLIDNPDFVMEAAQNAVARIDVPALEIEKFEPYIRFFNLPKDRQFLIRDISAEHLGKMIAVEGIIRQITDVLPKLKVAAWQCRRCGNVYKKEQGLHKVVAPSVCQCKQRDFELLADQSVFIDYQKIEIQESLENIKGNEQAQNITIYVSNDQVNRVTAGDRTLFVGMLRLSHPDDKKTIYGRFLDAIHLEETQKEFSEVEISPEEEKEIRELAKDPKVYDKLIASLAPAIYGHDVVKESIVMQLFGGVRKVLPGQNQIRGNIHILLVGDPGAAKSTILLATNNIAPKSIYVAGKTATGAGLSATAVKDEFGEGGWTLKAGALVLASGGLAAVDEFDKMQTDDRSAMHEALEQQSYHRDFEILLADGSTKKIGELVDGMMDAGREKIIFGKDCEILPVDGLELLSTDFDGVMTVKADRVSRHKAPEHFVEITYSNGRKITVTPEHPIFVFGENLEEVCAENVHAGMVVPGVKSYPLEKRSVSLDTAVRQGRKSMSLPLEMNAGVGKLLGYVASEGHSYHSSENRYAEIGVSNTDRRIVADMQSAFENAFSAELNIRTAKAADRKKATKDLATVRCSSLSLYDFFGKNFAELLKKAPDKRAPDKIKSSGLEITAEFLRAAFNGDGFVDSQRFGYSTASYDMACDYQDILLQHGVYSYIASEQAWNSAYFKVVISGTKSMQGFIKIADPLDRRLERMAGLCARSENGAKHGEILPPAIPVQVNEMLKGLGLSNGFFVSHQRNGFCSGTKTIKKYLERIEARLESAKKSLQGKDPRSIRKAFRISLACTAEEMRLSPGMITCLERNPCSKNRPALLETAKKMATGKLFEFSAKCSEIRRLADSEIKWLKIEKVEKKKNVGSEWVYDVTVEPTHCFVSAGLVLHNTISVAKAGIVTKFKTDTSVLAAANPKFSRFDPYQPFISQIDLPPTLISRFDLFFMIRDILDRQRDEEITAHILKTHHAGEALLQAKFKGETLAKEELDEIAKVSSPPISTDLFKKFVSFARQTMFPVLSKDAIEMISEFYINLRNEGKKDGSYAATHRQLEGLVRISEASAKIRLSDTVDKEDAARAIRLVRTSLENVVTDPETGKIDIDIITSGQTHTKLTNMKKILQIVKEKAVDLDMVPIDDVVAEAESAGISKEKTMEIISDLDKKGEIYKPRHHFVKPTHKG